MAGHKKMQADTLREPKRAERSRPGAPDPGDPWAADAPVDRERATGLRQSEDRPGSIAEGQHRALERLLSMLHIESRDDRHDAVSLAAGLPAGSFGTLAPGGVSAPSYAQAAAAIRELDRQASEERQASHA